MEDAALVFVILVALGFDFVNGFHDAANSIATIVATRVLTPRMAMLPVHVPPVRARPLFRVVRWSPMLFEDLGELERLDVLFGARSL